MYMLPGRHKGEPCFYLNTGNDHASDCCKIMLSPSGAASYSTDVTWGYRRAPFVGEWTTDSGGGAMTVPPLPAKGGAASAPTPQPEAPQGVEVWYKQAPPVTGASPDLPPSASSVSQRQEAPVTGATPEPPPPASSVSQRPEAPVASASPEPPPPAPSVSQRQEVPVASASPESMSAPPPPISAVQQQPQVSPAVTRSASRQQGGLGLRHGFVSMLAARKDIDMDIVVQSPPHMPAPELPSRPASELVTPDTYRQACMGEDSDVWRQSMDAEYRGLQRAGTFGEVVDESGGGM